MRKPLKLLMIEDSDDDAALLLRELRHNGYEPTYTRVETSREMQEALDSQKWDLITSDYSMPEFSAPDALNVMKSKSVDLPFIIVSGTIGEDYAVSALKSGAHDFIIKGKMSRLIPAIERELREAEGRRARREAEQALVRYAEEVTDLYDNAPCGYHSLDKNGVFIRINQTELTWLGYSRDEVVHKKKFVDVLTPDGVQTYQRTIELFKKQDSISGLEFEMVRKDGTAMPVLMNGVSVKDSAGNVVMSRAIIIDNTQHKRLEEQLRQSQKMEAVGQLAGGIAHDFNNLLTVIIGHSQLMMSKLHAEDQMNKQVGLILKTGERAANLTRQLLAFSRRQVLEPKILDLNAILTEIEGMLRRLIPENVRMVFSLDSNLSRVKVDAGQIEQVIMNLVINARDAISKQGAIIIETSNVELAPSSRLANSSIKSGPYVMLTVSDNGSGMTKEVKSHLFEPFFTTKDLGKGTGLGLSTVYGIVKQSGGHIEVYSEVGKGTSFKIYLPQAAGEIQASQSNQQLAKIATDSEVILLVEDDDAVRDVVEEMLKFSGFTVLLASDGGEALALCENQNTRIDLIMTDMVMPKMTGPELAERLQSVRPGTKVLFMSGYTEQAIVNSGELAPNTHFINKPFSPVKIAQKIRSIISAV